MPSRQQNRFYMILPAFINTYLGISAKILIGVVMSTKKELVTVYTARQMEAQILKGRLESEGIPVLLSRSPERSEGSRFFYEILREVYPERDSSVASLPQNDKKRRAQNDRRLGEVRILVPKTWLMSLRGASATKQSLKCHQIASLCSQ